MPDANEKPDIDPEGAPPKETGGEPADTLLPRPVQEHLAQQLRAAYQAMDEKPAFLGDPAIPPQFEGHIQRLDRRVHIREQGIEAVKAALGDLTDDTPPQRPARKRDAS